MYQYILFDLDGTLTDPKEGITKSFQYALKEEFGIEENDLDKLERVIGPPLCDSFRDFGIAEEDLERAVEKYRERYRPTGVFENEVYPGVNELLKELKEQGKVLAVASSKPQEFVDMILEKFELRRYFTVVVGSDGTGKNEAKTDVLETALGEFSKRAGRQFDKSRALMVGDRKYDVEAAQSLGIDSAAVTYGYAPEGELSLSAPTYMADSVQKLEEIISGQPSYLKYRNKSSLLKTCEILWPLLAYWAFEMAVFNILYFILHTNVYLSALGRQQWNVYLNAVSSIAVVPLLAAFYRKSAPADTSPVITRRKKGRLKRDGVLIAAYASSLALGLNIMIAALRLANLSERYQNVSGTQYSVALPVGLVIYGLLTPFTEEIIFRGVIYNRIKKYFPMPLAVALCALVFGCYHGNLVQIIYATIMGLAMTLLYEIYGHLAAPYIFHATANSLVYFFSKTNSFDGSHVPVLYAGALLMLAAGITVWYLKNFQRRKGI